MNEQEVKIAKPKKVSRRKYFSDIVADYNESTGFSFVLDELNPSEDYKYAHATYSGGTYKITCQMDVDSDKMYALNIKFDEVSRSVPIGDSTSKAQLDDAMKSEAFKKRIGAFKLLNELQERLDTESQSLTDNLISDSITEMQMQDTYDAIMLVSRKLLRDV